MDLRFIVLSIYMAFSAFAMTHPAAGLGFVSYQDQSNTALDGLQRVASANPDLILARIFSAFWLCWVKNDEFVTSDASDYHSACKPAAVFQTIF